MRSRRRALWRHGGGNHESWASELVRRADRRPFDLFGLPPRGRPVTMTGQEIFRARDGQLAEVWHQEDAPGMLRQLGLEPPTTIMRLAARRSARRYRRELAATR